MTSEPHGKHTSKPEVTHVSSHGVWMLARGKEFFMSFEDFPWFRDAPIGKVVHVEEPVPGHFHWPELDIDLTADIIENPGKYPLKAR